MKKIIGLILMCILGAICVEFATAQYKSYLDSSKLPSKVTYTLKKPLIKVDRKGYFKSSDESLDPSLYVGSGYDRGHMFPALYAQSEQEMKNTFNMKNVAPQAPGLNRGEWKQLESYIYDLAMVYDSVYVECGYIGIKKYIGELPIPKYYWKTIIVYHEGYIVTEEYLFPNATPKEQGFEHYILIVN